MAFLGMVQDDLVARCGFLPQRHVALGEVFGLTF